MKIDFYCTTASRSSVTTLTSDENDDIEDFDEVPSPKRRKTKDYILLFNCIKKKRKQKGLLQLQCTK
jgi:hypothetical protein